MTQVVFMNRINSPRPLVSSVSRKRILLAVSLFIPALLLLALPFYQPGNMPYLFLFLGRFHPVMLHFPIVLIILVLVLEILRRSGMLRKADLVIAIILVAAALSALLAIGSGFLLFASGDYSGAVLQQHFWIGVITGAAILCTVAFFMLYRHTGRFYSIYFIALLASNGAVAFTSHLGGSLTHGEDYLTEYLPVLTNKSQPKIEKPRGEMLVFDDVIAPVFEAKCLSCHNDGRARGELSMTTFEKMMKGGESGHKGIVPGMADSSELYKRIVLPEYHDDRMPPEGKTPMTRAETDLLKLWIQSGADLDQKVSEIKDDSAMGHAVANVLPNLARYRRKQEIAKARDEQLQRELQKLAFHLNVVIEKDSASDEGLYAVSMKFPPASFTTDQFRELVPFSETFSRLSLVASGLEDDGLYHISRMPNVKGLYLQKTNIDGSGLVHLKNMKSLEVLNLSYTRVDDKAALELLNIPNLREVYLFQTQTSPEVAKALQAYKPSLRVYLEEGPYL